VPFPISMALVVVISSAVLLYQFWSGTLVSDDGDNA
jgi:hypothetical protein